MTVMMWLDQLLHLALHLGVLGILYVGVVRAIAWRHRPLLSPPRTVDGERVRIYEGRYNDRIYDIQLEFEVPDNIQFTLRREGSFDRLARPLRRQRTAAAPDQHQPRPPSARGHSPG